MSTPHVMCSLPSYNVDSVNDFGSVLQGAPDWLTKDYIENCLKTHFKDKNIELLKVKAQPALGKGENYGGILTRLETDFQLSQDGELKKEYFIIKTSYEADEFSRKMMEPYDIFNREMTIYEKVLPKLNHLLAEIGDNEQIFAKAIAVDYARSALIFEDLNAHKFTMPNRLEGLDMQHAKIILRKIAKRHATSAVLNERENGSLQSFDRGMFNRYTENYKPAFVGLLEAGTEMITQWPGFEMFVRKLRALQPHYMEFGKRVFDPIKGHFNVLAHGDLWTNNVMVQYDETTGELCDVKIIDFQYAAWGSPAIDLYYFFNTSLKENLHINGQDELIKYYYSVLELVLRKLHFKETIPSLHRFFLQLEEKEFYAFSSTFVILAVQRNEFTEDADFNALMQEDKRAKRFKAMCYKNSYCQRIIRQLLPKFEQRGLLEVNQ